MLEPVYATKFLDRISAEDRLILQRSGIVPVNDIYFELWQRQCAINLLYGGRGGGKSEAVYDKMVHNALTHKYFNLYYGRKVRDKVHKSCFESLHESIVKLGVKRDFTYSTADNSTMVIRCKHNDNKMQPFGADKPESLKSIKDPSHVILEEADQFDFFDLTEIIPVLRTPKAFTELYMMFNTKDVRPDHWIMKVFFPDKYEGDDKAKEDLLDGMDIRRIFANYYDNHFIDHEEYRKKLWLSSGGSKILFDCIANGAWGINENGKPWLYSFRDADVDRTHIRRLPHLRQEPIYLAFDFNADPVACTAWQKSNTNGGIGCYLHCIREFGGAVKIDDLCDRIKTAFPASIFFVCGDRSGQNQDVGRNQTLYQMIQAALSLTDKQMHLNTHNLEHADSRLLCNAVFEHYPVLIDESCTNLIADCRKATIDPKSVRGNQLLKNREDHKMDYFDSMRYFMQTYMLKYMRDNHMVMLNA